MIIPMIGFRSWFQKKFLKTENGGILYFDCGDMVDMFVVCGKDLSVVARGRAKNLPALCVSDRADECLSQKIHVCRHIMI